LVEEYPALRAQTDTDHRGLRHLVELADLHWALDALPNDLFEVVLLVGLLGMDVRTASVLLHKSKSSVDRRYRDALAEMTFYINGGVEL
jgi:DNA-directed RNA polymerase specialized sigma24 family protein